MRILYVCQYYPPEMGAPAARASELASHWVRAGHDVTVLTGFPNHPTGTLDPGYRSRFWRGVCREEIDGTKIVRTWLLPYPNRKAYERILNYSSFCLSAALTGSFVQQPDVVIATSPQLLVGLSGWWIAQIKDIPLIFEVRDLWPESLTGVGLGSQNSALAKVLGRIAGFLYKHCNHLVVVTPAFKDFLVSNWNVSAEKISIVENGVEPELFAPGDSQGQKAQLGLEGKFVVSYIGTMGMAHGLTTILATAARLQHELPNVIFLLVGEGADKERLVALAAERNLTNIRFVSQQPRSKIPGIIQASDLCLVLLKKAAVFETVIPTKMLEFMSCGRPILLGVEGQARRIMEDADAGVFVQPESDSELAQKIRFMYDSAAMCERMGQNGRQYILNNLSREQTAAKYLRLMERLLGSPTVASEKANSSALG